MVEIDTRLENDYEDDKVIYIKDQKQQRLYLKHGAKLVDVIYDKNDDKIFFVFWKDDFTKELFIKWKNHELF